MKVLLLANQPESTTRLKLFGETLGDLGFSVIIPSFGTRNWVAISRASRNLISAERPDVVHLFNVPDIIYRSIPSLKGTLFTSLIYDYRSPWGIEYQMNFGRIGKITAEHFEKKLARGADLITTVNSPLREKVQGYLTEPREVHIIPNYPKRSFTSFDDIDQLPGDAGKPVLFVGRVCKQEGIENVLKAARENPDKKFWIVGDGPFSWYYLLRQSANLDFFGWQPHSAVARFIRCAGICLIPREENALTPYSNDKSIWKLNEYLNLGKLVVASGISSEESRINLKIVPHETLSESIRTYLQVPPQPLSGGDYRFWEQNRDLIKKVYETI
jgi:glycosyltransferase involved in cell wall biosynthesis